MQGNKLRNGLLQAALIPTYVDAEPVSLACRLPHMPSLATHAHCLHAPITHSCTLPVRTAWRTWSYCFCLHGSIFVREDVVMMW